MAACRERLRGHRSRRSASPRRPSPSARRRSRWRAGLLSRVAVYTDGRRRRRCAPSWPTTSWARRVALEGIAEGVENSNFRLADRARPLHPDHLREARRPGRPAVLPGPDGASGPPRPALPAAGPRPRRRRRCAGSRASPPPSSAASRAAGRAGSRSSTARPWARRWRSLHLAAADFALTRAQRARRFAGWRAAVRGLPRQGRRGRARAGGRDRGRARRPRARLARATCRPGVIHADLFPGQRLLRRRPGHRHHRLLLRLQRPARLRRRDLPERLVLRARRLVQRHQGPGAAAGLPPPPRRCARPRSRPCRCWRAARRCAS